MALREFTDRSGAVWRVWDVTPDQLHPRTLAEDYMRGMLDGWLTFERVDGSEKRRLVPVPTAWTRMRDDELESYCRAAEPVKMGARWKRAMEKEVPAESDLTVDTEPAQDIRTMLYPGGRVWTVTEKRILASPALADQPPEERTMLRFTSGTRSLDLLTWPRDWMHFSESQLADLLFSAFPREPGVSNPTPYQRRRSDQAVDAS